MPCETFTEISRTTGRKTRETFSSRNSMLSVREIPACSMLCNWRKNVARCVMVAPMNGEAAKKGTRVSSLGAGVSLSSGERARWRATAMRSASTVLPGGEGAVCTTAAPGIAGASRAFAVAGGGFSVLRTFELRSAGAASSCWQLKQIRLFALFAVPQWGQGSILLSSVMAWLPVRLTLACYKRRRHYTITAAISRRPTAVARTRHSRKTLPIVDAPVRSRHCTC